MGVKDYDKARKAFEDVLKIDKNHCVATYNLTQLHANASSWSQVKQHGARAARCLTGDAKRNAFILVGDAYQAEATKVVGNAGEDDTDSREKAIGVYARALEQYRAARAVRGSAGLTDKMTAIDATVENLKGNIAVIRGNREADAANKAAEEEEGRQQEMIDALKKKTGRSNGR